jgi:hypothetical protein
MIATIILPRLAGAAQEVEDTIVKIMEDAVAG